MSRATVKCTRCGVSHKTVAEAAVCCLVAPRALGWCAWCGGECARTFCSEPCAISYRDDVFFESQPVNRAHS